MADIGEVSGIYKHLWAVPTDTGFISGLIRFAWLVGPLTDVPPLSHISGVYRSLMIEPPLQGKISGIYRKTWLVGPLEDPVTIDASAYNYLLPAMAAREEAIEFFARLVDPMVQVKKDLAYIAACFVDIQLACESTLDLLGDIEGEARGGLPDDEYRRIILARRAAKYGTHSLPGIYQAWLTMALATDPADVFIMRLLPATVFVYAYFDADPTFMYVSRIGRVLADLPPTGYQIAGVVGQPDVMNWGDDWGLDWGFTIDANY